MLSYPAAFPHLELTPTREEKGKEKIKDRGPRELKGFYACQLQSDRAQVNISPHFLEPVHARRKTSTAEHARPATTNKLRHQHFLLDHRSSWRGPALSTTDRSPVSEIHQVQKHSPTNHSPATTPQCMSIGYPTFLHLHSSTTL